MAVTFTDNLRRTQDYMKKKWLSAEAEFYDTVDELTEKLKDLELGAVPEFKFKTFQFLHEWEKGAISSREVFAILETINPTEVAHKQVLRKLTNFMFENEMAADHIKGYLSILKTKVCPLYESYLKFLTMYFRKMSAADADMEDVTWLQVVIAKDDSFTTHVRDLTINQVVKKIDTYYFNDMKNSYWFGKNVIVIDEEGEEGSGERATHWIFAPSAYINLLKEIYDVDMELDIEGCGSIKNIIQELAI